MLGCAHHAGVERVEVHFERIGDIARHHRPLEEMDVVEAVDDTGGIVDVLQQRLAVFALLDIDQVNGSARGAVMHPLALDHHVVFGILAMEGEVARRPFDRIEDQGARETDAAIVAVGGAGLGQRIDAGRDGIGEADRLQQCQHRLVDALAIIALERTVAAALETGAHRSDVVGQGRCPHGAARFASTGPARALVRRGVLLLLENC